MTWNIPNILTVGRLLAAPALALVYIFFGAPYADWAAVILFAGASATDWLDGYLARKWNQTSRFGAMLDPIADKAMVITALFVLVALFNFNFWIAVPAVAILFREVFVSGLREFLGAQAGLLKVTKLAKWKTTVQMVAIAVLLSNGLFAHYVGMGTFGMDGQTFEDVLNGVVEGPSGLIFQYRGMIASEQGGILLLWIAAALTLITGWDYFRKSLPFLRDDA
ncbi:CDP-diacylglycerol--glycerol-3-phosphate 3-phosphatidyltransferase [Actibacterium pelagium]|uniref:CDP-diacylglycerol--glycerol-3-phosphate 3-phosphatidyltransferase n=1 Tax=Actibacterium pelagium TaxID=2029103 RepID=A0A917ELX5_9RHOB|nr:CDP-diacylglycerol--glycerol-3-phosphate 3-phosphatidyltransferase [Actibacterium pelagium]GGE58785.1 CDP-diacylglycerol--glycerol-3-phosphate 3-phosphatidyltransferase [Actibacterium pelagium]